MVDASIRIHGGDELAADLRDVARSLDSEVKKGAQDAADLVVDEARTNAGSAGGVAAKSAPAVGSESSGQGAGVGLDTGGYPFAYGAETGASQYPQFQSYVGPEGGYFIAPAVDSTEDRVVDLFEDVVDHLLDRNGL